MAKSKTQYRCTKCGHTQPKWEGRCSGCGEWNTLEEELIAERMASAGNNRFSSMTTGSVKVENLADVEASDYIRFTSGIGELDRVLGGGFVSGGVVLLGGEPGIGKSTLLLQALSKLSEKEKVLYVSGEESPQQIALRGRRLNTNMKDIRVYAEIELEKIISALHQEKPKFVVIDSIQTTFSGLLTSAPGSVSQVKECATQLNRHAKETGVTMILVGQITKEGDLAGPRALEHIVDAVLYFEASENDAAFRMIRAYKNRFGSVNEVGIFSMTSEGLMEVNDPSNLFTVNKTPVPGSSIFVTQEGNRPILVEVQALLDETNANFPIKSSVGLDQKRLSMLLAILNKFLSFDIYKYNVFVSVIGGMKIQDPASDLPTLLAMISSYKNISLPSDVVSFAEIGLTGEIRTPLAAEDKIKEASRMGFKRVITGPMKTQQATKFANMYNIEIIQCNRVHDVILAIQNI
jgi:DNA repair protein RadA/Sms